MVKDISLLLPTRGHPRLVKQLFDSIIMTTSDPERLEIVLYVDQDDTESLAIDHPLLSFSKLTGHGETMGSITRKCYEKSQGKYVLLLNDDMIFRTKNWDLRVLGEFARFTDGVALVYGNDLYYGKRMPTFPILSRTTCELMEKICPPDYRRHCIDPHILDVFDRLARLGHERSIYLRHVVFEHMHYELGLMMSDPEYAPASDADDQERYFSFADSRQRIAENLARYIRDFGSVKKTGAGSQS